MTAAVESFRFVRSEKAEALPPPNLARGPVAWVKENLFSGPFNTILTLLAIYIVYLIGPPLFKFLIWDAVWSGVDRDACRSETAGREVGACWPFVRERFSYFVYGSYPVPERWRVDIVFALGAIGVGWVLWLDAPRRALGALYFFLIFPVLAYGFLTGADPFSFYRAFGASTAVLVVTLLVCALAYGFVAYKAAKRGAWDFLALVTSGIVAAVVAVLAAEWLWERMALTHVPTSLWGGMLVTFTVSAVGIVFSLPLGILLALGRRSKLPLVRVLSVIFIEFVRGVPLITVLFMANTMLPLFLPEGMTVDRLMRPLVGVAIFAAAYMAEVVRGGLQAMPKGQYEGAQSLGLNYPKMMIFIILPQALRIVIPGIVNTFIGLFKDTTLVAIVGIFDLIRTIEASRNDPTWAAPTVTFTGYAFAAAFYFIFCYGMSRYSTSVERRLAAGQKR